MIQIRAEQVDVLEGDARGRFVRRLCAELRGRFPAAAAMDPERLSQFAGAEVDKALGCGIASEAAVAAFVLAAWQLGAGFDLRQRGAGAVLDVHALPAEREARLIAFVRRLGVFASGPAHDEDNG